MPNVLFVCFGNICRSTMAEALFRDFLRQRGQTNQWKVDSAGHGDWHLGNPPDPRTQQVLQEHGIQGYTHAARLVTPEDFNKFDYILGMDEYNLRNLQAIKPPNTKCKLSILGEYDPQGQKTIFDPYFCDCTDAYETVYQQCYRSCQAFLEETSKKPK